jgi:hypothetical protein
MYTYFLILNDFGIRPQGVWYMSEVLAPLPKKEDLYDINAPNLTEIKDANGTVIGKSQYGNTNMGINETLFVRMAWDMTSMAKIDIRLFYAGTRDANNFTKCRWDPNPNATGFP